MGNSERDSGSSGGTAGAAGAAARQGRTDFDVVVVGGGSAGYAAARVAAQRGARVGLVESGPIGGLCVLEGCMPSKALLHPAALFHRLRGGADLGVRCDAGRLDFARVMARKRELVAEFAASRREELYDTTGVTVLRGRARLAGAGEVAVRPLAREPRRLDTGSGGGGTPPGEADGGRLADEERRYSTRKVIITTGSFPWIPPLPGIEEVGYITSADALDLDAAPESMAIIGAGAIALELGQFYARAGTRVTMLEQAERILDEADSAVSAALAGYLREDGIELVTGATVESCARDGERRLVRATVGGERRTISAQVLLVALGRHAHVAGLGLDAAGVELDGDSRFLKVDREQRTTNPDVYAAGDVGSKRQMTHLAVLQGEVAGHNVAVDLGLGDPERPLIPPAAQRLGGVARVGPDGRLSLDTTVVPQVLYTDPGYARVGTNEPQATEEGIKVVVASYRFDELGMARVMGETKGLVKMVARRDDGRLLGVEVLGHQAETLIHEAVLALAFGATAEQMAKVPRYHPTLSEVFAYVAEELAGR